MVPPAGFVYRAAMLGLMANEPNRAAVVAGFALISLGTVGGVTEIAFDRFPSPGAFLAVFAGAMFMLMLMWRWLFGRH